MSKPTQIYIDDSGRVHVSYPCDTCSEWVHTEDHCGDTKPDGTDEYMCGDCYGKRAVQNEDHDWLIFTDNPIGCPIAIHKDVMGPSKAVYADRSSLNPDESITRFGPGSLSLSMTSINDLHMDVHHVHTLWDEGYLNDKAHLIFTKSLTFGQRIVIENMVEWLQSLRKDVGDTEDHDSLGELIEAGMGLLKGGAS